MRIKKLHIRNFKSSVDFELEDLKPFCAFVGPNASGKSNIFEALEFTNYVVLNSKFNRSNKVSLSYFGGATILSYNSLPITNIGGRVYGNMTDSDIAFFYEFADTVSINFYTALSGAENLNVKIVPIGRKPDPTYITKPDLLDLFDERNRVRFINELNESGIAYENDYEQFIDNFSRIFVGKPSLVKFPSDPGKLNIDAS